MLNKARFFLSLLLISALYTQTALSQYYTLGNDPFRARWRQITSEHYKIIYPEETDSLARLYLYTLEKVRPTVMSELNIDPRPIPVVLHPYTTQSNGVVTWAPKRMDLFSSPDPYESNPDAWIPHLTVHESRHVGQVEHFTKGIYNVFYYPFGEQITGLGLGLFISGHVLEGDAVVAETELTQGGRGRNADFTKYVRAMYINRDFRSWDRMLFGSSRYYTPNEYVFGYLMQSYVRYESGITDLIGQYMSTPVKGWYSIGRLIEPIKYVTGTGKSGLFRRSQEVLGEMWRNDYLSRSPFTGYTVLPSKKERLYTDFSNPIYISDTLSPYFGSVLLLKEGMETARKLVMIDSSGKEHFLRFFNPVASRPTYDGKNHIYWSESITNNAADIEDFSVIMSFDILTGKTGALQHRAKYFNPAPSTTGDTLAVAEYPVTGGSFLTFLSSDTGEPLFRIKAPGKGQIRESVFVGDTVYCSVILEDGIGIFSISLPEREWSMTVAPQHQSISGLKAYKDNLYFSSDLDGVLNIYRYDLGADSLLKMTNSGYGADYPYFDPSGKVLYYCEYGLDGYRPVKAEYAQLSNTAADFSTPYKWPLAEIISAQSKERLDSTLTDSAPASTDILNPEKYPSKKYNKLLHSFRIHSWFPVYVDVDRIMSFSFERFSQVASLGATILSQNTLGSVITSLSYGYVKDSYYTGKYFHSGHFSIDTRLIGNLALEARFDVNERNAMTNVYDLTLGGQYYYENPDTPLLSASAMLYWPLRLNSRGWYRSLTPFVSWSFTNDRYFAYAYSLSDNSLQALDNHYIMRHQLQFGLSYGQTLPTAGSQIYPRWGFGITLRGVTSPGSGRYFKDLIYANGYAYLPGLTRQQGLKIGFTAQLQMMQDKYLTSSIASLPRGYNRYSYADTYINLTADYAIPIYLGDFSLGPILYVKRLQLIPFADYAMELNHGGTRTDYFSYGADVLLDFNIIRLSFPISAGVRYARTGPNEGWSRNHFELLFNISF